MPYTVWGAFDWYRNNIIDLDIDQTKRARGSRDYLFDQLKIIEGKDVIFPKLTGSYISYGSFARSTKIRPLNDIDLLVLLNGTQTEANQSTSDPYKFWLTIKDPSAPLAKFPDNYGYVNSIKVLNKIKYSLTTITNYQKAEIHRNQQAITLNLSSYPWVIDIVPAVPINNYSNNGTAYFLIPDGNGDWIRTDPRKDQSTVTDLNQRLNGNLLPTIRLLKAWNKRTTKPVLPSYYFENLAIKVFQQTWIYSSYQNAINYFFENCPAYLWSNFPDPKGLGPDLDSSISVETKQKISEAMKEATTHCGYAIMYENNKDEKNAIYWWGRVFGGEFPVYG
jgi:hypothetical protein